MTKHEAALAATFYPDTQGTPIERLERAIIAADLNPEDHGPDIAAFAEGAGISAQTLPANLAEIGRLFASERSKAAAAMARETAAAALANAGEIIQQLQENVGRGVPPDDPEMAAKAAEASQFLAELGTSKRKPIESLPDFLKRKFYDDSTRRHGDLLGLPLARFGSLARMLDGIQPGFYIAAAETNIGKTTFLANVFLDALEANPRTPGLYLTLDDPKCVIVDRFVAILSRLAFHQQKGEDSDAYARNLTELNINALRKNLDHSPRMKASKEEAAAKLAKWATDGRIDIRDITDLATGAALESCIRGMAKDGQKPFVVIDALFNLDIGSEVGNLREENIARAQFLKRISDDLEIPIWTTAEIRKKDGKDRTRDYVSRGAPTVDDIMESSKYAYNANAVFMLYPEKRENFFKEDAPYIVIDVQKNKLSDFKRPLFATFTKRGAFMELSEGYEPAKTARKSDKETDDNADPANPFSFLDTLSEKSGKRGERNRSKPANLENPSPIYKGDLL